MPGNIENNGFDPSKSNKSKFKHSYRTKKWF
jgi:hypothetical protein